MSFSATPTFDDAAVQAANTNNAVAQSAPGVAFFTGAGNPYAGTTQIAYDTDAGDSTIGGGKLPTSYSFSRNGLPEVMGQADSGGNYQDIYAYDPSKYSDPRLAYLDSLGNGNATGLSNIVQGLGLNPDEVIQGLSAYGHDQNGNYGWLGSPQAFLQSAAAYNPDVKSVAQPWLQQSGNQDMLNYGQELTEQSGRENHLGQSLNGSDYGQIVAGMLGVAAGPLIDMAFPAATAGMAAGDVGADTFSDYASQVGTSLLKKALPKLVGNAISGQNPTKGVVNPTMATSFFADGGSVDDFSPDDLPDPTVPDFPTIDSSSFGTPVADANLPNFDWGRGSLSMGMVNPSAAVNDPENQGTMGNMSGYDPNAAPSPNAPQASDAHMPAAATGASQSAIGGALQKLGYMNSNGDVDLGKALKAGATIAALAVTYLNNKKLASSGAQMAASQVQPGQVFTLPGTALSGTPSYGIGKPTNSNSVVQFRAQGGPLGAPTGAMPPAMLPQGGMNRMPGASPQGPGGMPPPMGGMGGNPQAPAPTMPMGGPPSWQGMAPPPSATPAPSNHFAHGGALGMAQHAQNYQGHAAQRDQVTSGYGAVRGMGGGQDDIVDARMAPGEYVFDADTVAALGDGSSEEGARRLDAWRKHLREHKRSAPASDIPPKAHAAPHYLGGAR